MKFVCTQPELQRALGLVGRAIRANATLPILENILLRAESKHLYLTATNLETTIECSIEVQVINEGQTTVPAKLFDAYVSLLPKGENVEVTLINTVDLEIKTMSSETVIKGLNPDDFPLTPAVDKQGVLTLSAEKLHEGISRTIYATASNPSRPVLTGIYTQIKGDKVILVGTDSYRLSEHTMTVKKADTSIEECNIPAQTMAEVLRIFPKTEDDIEITLSKNQVQFSQNGIRLVSRLIEGRFPPYRDIIPKTMVSRAILSVSDLLMAIKRISLFARENNNTIRFEFETDEVSKVVLSSTSAELGSGRTELPCTIEGEAASIPLNSGYLIDFLSTVNGEYVYFDVDTKNTPAVLRPKERDDYFYLVMPLKGE